MYRPTSLLVFSWIEAVGATEIVLSIRNSTLVQSWEPSAVVLYSLPDMLWVVSFGHALYAVLVGSGVGIRRTMLVALGVGGLGLGSEIGQGLGVVPGTFDWYDMLFYAIGVLWLIIWAWIEARVSRGQLNARSENHG